MIERGEAIVSDPPRTLSGPASPVPIPVSVTFAPPTTSELVTSVEATMLLNFPPSSSRLEPNEVELTLNAPLAPAPPSPPVKTRIPFVRLTVPVLWNAAWIAVIPAALLLKVPLLERVAAAPASRSTLAATESVKVAMLLRLRLALPVT